MIIADSITQSANSPTGLDQTLQTIRHQIYMLQTMRSQIQGMIPTGNISSTQRRNKCNNYNLNGTTRSNLNQCKYCWIYDWSDYCDCYGNY